MNANEMTLGVEIETVAPDSALRNEGLRIGSYHCGIQVPYLPDGWKAERDGSIRTAYGSHACEIVSPILRGPEGLAQVAEVIEKLKAKGHHVNESCGVHIHIGWSRDLPAEALARLVTIVSYCERGLYAITGTKSRERGRWCGGVRKYGNGKDAKPALDQNRYHALNLTSLANGVRETVEFRIFSGSLNAVKIGFVVFVIPYLLVYFPRLMLIGETVGIITALITAMIGIVMLSAGMTGNLLRSSTWWERILCFVSGACLFIPGWQTDIVGFALAALIVAMQFFSRSRSGTTQRA